MEPTRGSFELDRSLTRRDLVRWAGVSALGASMAPLAFSTGCNLTPAERSFFLKRVFRFSPEGAVVDVAFVILRPASDYVLDYLDLDCPHCKIAFRIFLYSLEFGVTFGVACPGCSIAVRASIAGGRLLIGKLQSLGIRTALGLVTRGGFRIHRVGPATTRYGRLAVSRSAASYSISNREPSGPFDREIPALPAKINYFTHVEGARRDLILHHVWRRDGRITDRIPLEVGSNSWRTWSRKRNLAPGTWILTTEVEGAVLDLREFHIAE